MESNDRKNIEPALARTEADATATLKAAETVMRCLRRFRANAKVGNLRELRSSIEAAERAMASLRQQFVNAKEGWNFDDEAYFADGLYSKELVAIGQQMGISIFERDDRLYCYPVLIQVSAKDKVVLVDKRREPRVRPSILVTRLKELQHRPLRFRPETFLAALSETYSKAAQIRGKDLLQMAPVIPLLDIYELLTLLPGQAREYSKQEFARDIYLLHRSVIDTTKSGMRVSFPASTGTKTPSRTVTVITEAGEEKRYYGICFSPIRKEP